MRIRRLITSAVLILSCIVLPACQDSEEKKIKHYKRALEYIKIDDQKAAIIELRNAIQLDAKFADARYQLGLIFLDTGDPRAAFGELQRTVSLDPKNLDAGVKVAEFYLLSRDQEQSRQYVEQVLATDPNYQDALALLANLELIEGNFQQAESAIDNALSQTPDSDKYLNIKGRILVALGKGDEGEQVFRRAIQQNPDNFANYRTLLMYYEQSKNEPAQQELLDTMVTNFPDNPQLYMMLAALHEKKGDLAEAEAALIKSIENKNDSIPMRLMLSEYYKKYRQYSKAEEVLKTALADFPDEIELQVAYGDLLFDLRKFDESKAIMDKILTSNPANGGGNLIKARFLIHEQKTNEAIEVLTPLMSDYPKWADPFYYSALSHMRIGKIELAIKAIEAALQNNPSSDRFHALAAQIYLMKGNSNEATKEASIALRINNQNYIAVKILAGSYVQAKDFDKAIQLIELLDSNALVKDPDLLGTLGIAYLGVQDKEKAKDIFTRLIELSPENARVVSTLAALQHEGNLEKSLDFVQNHVSRHPSSGNYLLLGDLLVKSKQFEAALQSFEKAQELNPADPQGYIMAARLLSGMGKSAETEAKYAELLQSNPNSIAGLMGLAAVYESTGRTVEAKEKYLRVLELQPDTPAAANNLAWIIASEEGGDLGEALRLAMQAKQAMPSQPHIADTLGWVHYKRKSYPLAISQFKQALENRSDDPVIRYHLAMAQYANGEREHATQALEKIIAEDNRFFAQQEEAKALLESWKAQ